LVVSTVLMTPATYLAVWLFLPDTWVMDNVDNGELRHSWMAFTAVASGLWGGLIIGFVTEYYTSYNY